MRKITTVTNRFFRRWTSNKAAPVGRIALLGMAFLFGMVAA